MTETTTKPEDTNAGSMKMSTDLQGASTRLVTGYIKPQPENAAYTEQQIQAFCDRIDNLCLNEGPTGHDWSKALQIIKQLNLLQQLNRTGNIMEKACTGPICGVE